MTWSTRDEQAHIDGLGSFMSHNFRDPVKEKQHVCHLLEGYIRSALRRHTWDEINREVAIEHAHIRLAKVRGSISMRESEAIH